MIDKPFCIEGWRVLPSRNCLVRNGEEVRIEPKAMEVLLRLAAAPGEVVAADDLIDTVWGGRPISDNPVYKCVAQLRKALGDDQASPRFIETIPKKGYRLLAGVSAAEIPDGPVDKPERFRPRAYLFFLALAAILILLVAWWRYEFHPLSATPERETARPATNENQPVIAVLPFTDLSEKGDQAYFAHGMAEEVLHKLARNPGLKVIARTSSFSFASDNADIQTIAETLGVKYVLEGSVRRDGKRIRVTAQLIDASDSAHLWSEAYDTTLTDVLGIQDDIAHRIMRSLTTRMDADDSQARRPDTQTVVPEAYDLYLEGRYYLDRFDIEKVQRARDRFRQALDIDPGYGAAWAGLADSYTTLNYLAFLRPEEAAQITRAAAERALKLDPDLAGAHAALATVLTDYYFDWPAAETHFRKALELNPSYATAYQLYAEFLRDMGRFDEGLEMIRSAQSLEPLAVFNQLVEGIILDLGRRHAEAIGHYERLLALHPELEMTHFFLALAQGHLGCMDQGMASLEKADPGRRFPDAVSTRGAFYAASGRTEEARAVLTELDELSQQRYVSPFLYAVIYLSLGEHERAIDLLEQAVQEHSWFVRLYGILPELDPLRENPRFQRLLESVGLQDVEAAKYTVMPTGECHAG